MATLATSATTVLIPKFTSLRNGHDLSFDEDLRELEFGILALLLLPLSNANLNLLSIEAPGSVNFSNELFGQLVHEVPIIRLEFPVIAFIIIDGRANYQQYAGE